MRSYRDWDVTVFVNLARTTVDGHSLDGQFGELPRGYDHKYVYSHFGYNLKVTDMQAASAANS